MRSKATCHREGKWGGRSPTRFGHHWWLWGFCWELRRLLGLRGDWLTGGRHCMDRRAMSQGVTNHLPLQHLQPGLPS